MMKRLIAVTAAVLAAGLCTFSAFADDSISITVAHVNADGTVIDEGAQKFKELVEEKSGGSITVEVYGNSQLGQAREIFENIQMGGVDMCIIAQAPLAGFTDAFRVFDLPYLFDDAEGATKVLDGEIGAELMAKLDEIDMKCLALSSQSWRTVSSNKEVTLPSDMAGQKIRVQENEIHIAYMESLGASGIPMNYGELFTALQQGVVDGQENPLDNDKRAGFIEVQKYVVDMNYIYDIVPYIYSSFQWDRLTEEQQEIIESCAKEAATWQREFGEQVNEEVKQEFIDEGKCTVIELTDEQKAEWVSSADAVYEKYVPQIGEDLVQRIKDAQS